MLPCLIDAERRRHAQSHFIKKSVDFLSIGAPSPKAVGAEQIRKSYGKILIGDPA